jgi:hypothetical protein
MSQKRAKQIRKALRELMKAKDPETPPVGVEKVFGAELWPMVQAERIRRTSYEWDSLAVRKAEYVRAAKVMGVVDGRGKGSHSTERSKSEKPSQPEAAPEGL